MLSAPVTMVDIVLLTIQLLSMADTLISSKKVWNIANRALQSRFLMCHHGLPCTLWASTYEHPDRCSLPE